MGTPEFPDLGKHCNVEDCNLIDFLPFTCDCCDKVFCLQHRSYAKHICPNANQMDVTVLICPICARGVRLVPNEDPNITWDLHVNNDCDPSNYQKVTKKRRCPVIGCREVLVFSNTIKCKDCAQEHCLRHRFGPDHSCTGPKTVDMGLPFFRGLKSQKGLSLPIQSSKGPSKWSLSIQNAASSIMASAEAGMQRLGIATSQTPSNDHFTEQCVQCRARFSDVYSLIEHVEKVHKSKVKQAVNRVTVDVCPRCSKAFRDPVLLVEHVEKDHGGFSKR